MDDVKTLNKTLSLISRRFDIRTMTRTIRNVEKKSKGSNLMFMEKEIVALFHDLVELRNRIKRME